MMLCRETAEIFTTDEIYVCGEICSPTQIKRGKIYVGGLAGFITCQDESLDLMKRSKMEDINLDLFNCCSDTEEPPYSQNSERRQSKKSMRYYNDDIVSNYQTFCPLCEGPLYSSTSSNSNKAPPYCGKCRAYFILKEPLQDKEVLDNLVDSLLQNNDNYETLKGRIVLMCDEKGENLNGSQTNQSLLKDKIDEHKKYMHNNSLIEGSFSEDDEQDKMIKRTTTDDEQHKILQDIRKT